MRSMVWFRRDLRTHDHPALHAATKSATEGVVAVYVATPGQWRQHGDAPRKVGFWLDNLRSLSNQLSKLNIPLLIESVHDFADVPQALLRVASRVGAHAVHVNREYEVNESRRDALVERAFTKRGIRHHDYDDRTIVPPDILKTRKGNFFTAYSPFRRTWVNYVEHTTLLPLPPPGPQGDTGLTASEVPSSFEDFDLCGTSDHQRWPTGESAARRKLDDFIADTIERYDQNRDHPSVDGTSSLSPYLAAGVLSPRACLAQALRANDGRATGRNAGVETWISELTWRDFYTHVLVGFPRVSMDHPFDRTTKDMTWRQSPEELAAWKEGRTGYPLVDAGMRQLAQTGWMHNRLRMVTAMFLSKHLLIDWRKGESHFMSHLIDGDLAANNGGWQWSASTGTDAVPYFRIFNPYSQSKRFDVNGNFIREFCPELAEVAPKDLHNPKRFGQEERQRVGYPMPIVEHAHARERALTLFKTHRAGLKSRTLA